MPGAVSVSGMQSGSFSKSCHLHREDVIVKAELSGDVSKSNSSSRFWVV